MRLVLAAVSLQTREESMLTRQDLSTSVLRGGEGDVLEQKTAEVLRRFHRKHVLRKCIGRNGGVVIALFAGRDTQC